MVSDQPSKTLSTLAMLSVPEPVSDPIRSVSTPLGPYGLNSNNTSHGHLALSQTDISNRPINHALLPIQSYFLLSHLVRLHYLYASSNTIRLIPSVPYLHAARVVQSPISNPSFDPSEWNDSMNYHIRNARMFNRH